MAKKAIPLPLPVPIEEPAEQDCPKCPPKGAPAWMATFADIATLLMAFFVLILSFADFNQPKFKMIAGSLKESFGIQRQVPVTEQPKGTTLLELKFSPSPAPSVTDTLTQQTTETEKPELETKQSEADGEEGRRELAEALADALESGQLQAEMRNGEVVLSFADTPADNADAAQGTGQDAGQGTAGDGPPETGAPLQEQLAEAAKAVAEAEAQTGRSAQDVLLEGLTDKLADLAEGAGAATGPGGTSDGDSARASTRAEARLKVALRQEIGEGLVDVEQRDGKVFVTVGAGGAFPSGSSDLTTEARDIMNRIAFSAMSDAGEITVTGHTDDVPVNPTASYRDNWGLAAARASSVVREIGNSGLIAPDRLTAVSRGESQPVADNTTAAGREKNRRIEIEIAY
ncbi:flagellar motor protein MotB [Meridianimarinicoccus roseus]|jgi:chemotaxis protein MotB|uniref:Flagellar motor protein MotB n=1 Tax=Meridianimarinicoccus roseus TaxID=2072018 RepID=A0A2V2LF94_9RHOB|nr:OmpA family protein [Meridianimarinicoccus roseus]PWR02561.1 flagellar motor protein MotB [Meridianimarinicoccus roseus]